VEDIIRELNDRQFQVERTGEMNGLINSHLIMTNGTEPLRLIFKEIIDLRGRRNVVGPDGIEFDEIETKYLRGIPREDRPGNLPVVIIKDTSADEYYFMGKRELRIQLGKKERSKPKKVIMSRTYYINEFEPLEQVIKNIILELYFPDA